MKSRQNRHGTTLNGRPWTTREIQDLRRVASLGAAAAAEILGRSEWSVRKQAQRMRISLRRQGSRAGLVLGQPRGVQLPPDVRSGLLEGEADPERVAQRLQRLHREGAELCPRCAVRPQEVESTGLCKRCHLEELTQLYRIETDDLEAARAFDAERARRYRRRKAATAEVGS